MNYASAPDWRDHFVLASRVASAGTRAAFYRAAKAGYYTQLAHGVWLPTSVWKKMSADARYLATVRAVAIRHELSLVFSHLSAAALWRLPIIGPWPARAEVLMERTSGGRSAAAFLAHTDGLPFDLDRIDEVTVTTLARTVVDVARTAKLGTAVAMADYALAVKPTQAVGVRAATVTPGELRETLALHPAVHGKARAARVLGLASGLSGSPGESLSRMGMHLLGLPAPILQQEFRDEEGLMIVDFWWPEFNLVGEFDGKGKYLREDLLAGRTTAEALIAEKHREDRIRALGPSMVRWDWDVARSLPLLDAKLRGAGLC